MTTDTILNTLRRAVQESTKDRSQIAEDAGISRKTLYDLLEGNKDPRWSTLEALAQVLGLRFGLAPAVMGEMAPSVAQRAPTSMVTRLIADNATPVGVPRVGHGRAAELLERATAKRERDSTTRVESSAVRTLEAAVAELGSGTKVGRNPLAATGVAGLRLMPRPVGEGDSGANPAARMIAEAADSLRQRAFPSSTGGATVTRKSTLGNKKDNGGKNGLPSA